MFLSWNQLAKTYLSPSPGFDSLSGIKPNYCQRCYRTNYTIIFRQIIPFKLDCNESVYIILLTKRLWFNSIITQTKKNTW